MDVIKDCIKNMDLKGDFLSISRFEHEMLPHSDDRKGFTENIKAGNFFPQDTMPNGPDLIWTPETTVKD